MHEMMGSMWRGLILLILGVTLWSVEAQDYDFSASIKCYTCEGPADNSTCADPIEDKKDILAYQLCDNGMCIKWTKYRDGVLQMVRDCTANLNFHLTMIDGVCRTERDGNGYICMCGKSMCNSAPRPYIPGCVGTIFGLFSYCIIHGLYFLLPHWILSHLLLSNVR